MQVGTCQSPVFRGHGVAICILSLKEAPGRGVFLDLATLLEPGGWAGGGHRGQGLACVGRDFSFQEGDVPRGSCGNMERDGTRVWGRRGASLHLGAKRSRQGSQRKGSETQGHVVAKVKAGGGQAVDRGRGDARASVKGLRRLEATLLSHQDGGRDGTPVLVAQGPSWGGSGGRWGGGGTQGRGLQHWGLGRERPRLPDPPPLPSSLGWYVGRRRCRAYLRTVPTLAPLSFLPHGEAPHPLRPRSPTLPCAASPHAPHPTHWSPSVGTQCQRRASRGWPAEDGGGTGEGPAGS